MKLNNNIKYLISVFIYGTIGFFLHYTNVASEFVVMCRGLIGSIFIVVLLKIKKHKININNIKNNKFKLIISGIFLGLNWIFLFAGYTYGIAITSLCNYTAPIIIIIITCLLTKKLPNIKQFICILVSFIGIVLVSGLFEVKANIDYRCIIYGFMAAIGFTGLVLVNRSLDNIDPYEKTIIQLLVSAITVLPYVLLKKSIPVDIDLKSLIIVLILGIVHTGIAYIFYFDSIHTLSTKYIAIMGYIEPVLSVLIGAIIFNESMSIYGAIGTILIIGSAIVSELKSK